MFGTIPNVHCLQNVIQSNPRSSTFKPLAPERTEILLAINRSEANMLNSYGIPKPSVASPVL